MDDWKSFRVMYRIEVHGVLTDWQTLVMDKPYYDTLKAPELLTAIHWRMRDISLAIQKLESDVAKVVEFKVVEIKDDKIQKLDTLSVGQEEQNENYLSMW